MHGKNCYILYSILLLEIEIVWCTITDKHPRRTDSQELKDLGVREGS